MSTFLRHCEAHNIWHSSLSMKFLYTGWYIVFMFLTAEQKVNVPLRNIPKVLVLFINDQTLLFFLMSDHSLVAFSKHCFFLLCLFVSLRATTFLTFVGPILTCQIHCLDAISWLLGLRSNIHLGALPNNFLSDDGISNLRWSCFTWTLCFVCVFF